MKLMEKTVLNSIIFPSINENGSYYAATRLMSETTDVL